MECVSLVQRHHFNCTDIHVVRPKNKPQICYKYIDVKFHKMIDELERNVFAIPKNNRFPECKCLPLCNEIEYDLNVISIDDLHTEPTNSV